MPVTPRDWIELSGIVIAALASCVGAFLAVLRFRQERQHVKARLWVRSRRVAETEVVGQLGGELFNRGRRAQVLVVVVSLEGDGESLPVNPLPTTGRVELPRWIEPGEAFSFRMDLPDFCARVELILAQNFPGRGPVSVLMNKLRIRFVDGEGHDHWATLDQESNPALARWLGFMKLREAARREVGET